MLGIINFNEPGPSVLKSLLTCDITQFVLQIIPSQKKMLELFVTCIGQIEWRFCVVTGFTALQASNHCNISLISLRCWCKFIQIHQTRLWAVCYANTRTIIQTPPTLTTERFQRSTLGTIFSPIPLQLKSRQVWLYLASFPSPYWFPFFNLMYHQCNDSGVKCLPTPWLLKASFRRTTNTKNVIS